MKYRLAIFCGLLFLAAAIGLVFAGEVGPGYTETPSLDKIPAAPIAGMANGKPFAAKSVYFEPMFGQWTLIVADNLLAGPTEIMMGGQRIYLEMHEPPTAGKKLAHPMGDGGGFFQIMPGDDPEETTSWNAENAWVVEITKWEAKDYIEGGPVFQHAGIASGRVYVAYKGGDSLKDSWAAGTFTDAVVRYMGKPDFTYGAEKPKDE